MKKKYELTEHTIVHFGVKLYRIRALKDFGGVKKGDLGGYIEKEKNLDHDGECWVADDAKVYNKARVSQNAVISDTAFVFAGAMVLGNAKVKDDSKVFAGAGVLGHVVVTNGSRVSRDTIIRGNRVIDGETIVGGLRFIKG